MRAPDILDRLYDLLGKAALLPIPLKKKGPDTPGWQKVTYQQTLDTSYRAQLIAAIERQGNIGVLLGPASERLLAFDLDSDAAVDEWLGRLPWLKNTLRSRGKRGCQFWFRLEPGCQYPNGKAVFKLKRDGQELGELRLGGDGGAQSLIFGVHPDGMRYRVLVQNPPLVISLADLDEIAPGIFSAEEASRTEMPKPAPNGNAPSRRFDIWDRIVGYLDKCDPAVAGQCGHDTTYRVLCQTIEGFDLSPEQAWRAAVHYNQKCEPPWSEKELRHKVDDALKATSNEPRGHFLATPLEGRLKEEQVQSERAQQERGDERNGQPADGQPIDLERETKDRFSYYLSDPEPFPGPMRPEAFHGVIGQIVKIMVQHCEASLEVLLLHGIVAIGNILGRSAYVYGGGPQLFPNEFAVFVGETARGRKGTAYSMWEHLAQLVNRDWFDVCLSGQTQTGEGIVHRVRDERYGIAPGKKKKGEPIEGVLLDAGVSDKRLLILEEEFSHALKMAQRSGNTLSETLRKAWDSPRALRTDNKNSPLRATEPHVSPIGHTTRDELLGTLKMVDLNNGMANRVLWCAARRTGDMPNAEFLNWKSYPSIIEQLHKIFRQRFPNTADPAFFSRSPEAKIFWDTLYRKLNSEKQNGTIDAVLARDTSHILKIALIFAITDQASVVDVAHLKAALAVIDFCRDSARWIFGHATGNKIANNILVELRRRSPTGLTKTEIQNQVCYRTAPKSQLDAALAELAKNRLAKMTLEDTKKGPRIERWFAAA